MKRRVTAAISVAVLVAALPEYSAAQSLRGSPQTMQKQNRVAQQHDFTFLETSAQVRRFVSSGYLVELPGNANYELAGVSHPFARPAVKTFVERLSAQYHAACGEKLVVTSLTRPVLEQPRNASDLSVHPAGMAVDLRISRKSACVRWLENTLLSLEKQGVLDATKERRPPHYHIALFPQPYTRYVAALSSRSSVQLAVATEKTESPGERVVASLSPPAVEEAPAERLLVTANVPVDEPAATLQKYRVNRGDSLWSIARRHNTTVETLKDINGLRNARIVAGQTIAVPVTVADADES